MKIQERSWSLKELKNDLNNLESSLTFLNIQDYMGTHKKLRRERL